MAVLPKIIQGGMGVNISSWPLAQAVSRLGQQGTISGVALERIMARILQRGDPGGHIRRALSSFPFQDIANRVVSRYFVQGGISKTVPFKKVPIFTVNMPRRLIELIICASFAFVWLAKEGHSNEISINYMEKVAMPHLYAITGAMLAGVDCITMGAGIPLQVPAVINALLEGRPVEYRLSVSGTNIAGYTMKFNPENFFGRQISFPKRPKFLPIVASNLLAKFLKKKLPEGSIWGFVIEEPTAGGHNAPPRKIIRDKSGTPLPIYSVKDIVDYEEIAKLGLPFWIGGSHASPKKLRWALDAGAAGIQAGSIFALSEESGMDPVIRKRIRQLGFDGSLHVKTDMRISPTGFPFKVVCLKGTLSNSIIYNGRVRICNHGALAELYEKPDGNVGYRCPAEIEQQFVMKGGKIDETIGRGCLCSGLLSTAGYGDHGEPPIVTLGDDVSFLRKLMKDRSSSYTVEDAINWLLDCHRPLIQNG